MNANFSRGSLLYEQGRHELAEKEFRQALAANPEDAHAHAMLALCLAELKNFGVATAEAQQAVHLAPDEAFAHYALSRVFYDRNRFDEALSAITEAIRFNPTDSDYHSLMAGIHFTEKRWTDALAAAEKGLEFNSEHVACNNLRAMALVKLNRRDEAGATIETALARDPENSVTHANQGWARLEGGDRRKALEHFREALRLDPENEWARSGIVEALKAGNFIYALFLRYLFWMAKLSTRAQWAVLVGGLIGNRFLASLAKTEPAWAPWIWPIRILYLAFVFLTWTADPLFNLLLRLNRFGRLALSEEQIIASTWVGSCVGLALLAAFIGLITGFDTTYFIAAAVLAFLVIPLAAVFNCATGWPRNLMIIYSALMAVAGGGALACAALSDTWAVQLHEDAWERLAVLGLIAYFIGAIGSTWVANILVLQRPKR